MSISETAVRDALRQVIDPELGINIVDLGLVYDVEIDQPRESVQVVMTMTSPACPLGDYLKGLVDSTVKERLPEVREVAVALVWQPAWNPDMISDEGRRQLDGGL